jgi:hypothetical protein
LLEVIVGDDTDRPPTTAPNDNKPVDLSGGHTHAHAHAHIPGRAAQKQKRETTKEGEKTEEGTLKRRRRKKKKRNGSTGIHPPHGNG